MKLSEERYLKKSIREIRRLAKEQLYINSFYSNLDVLSDKSIQDLSFTNDVKFFNSINFILSVITSIVVRPHIANKREEVIIRSDLVSSFPSESFQLTMQDPSLWKIKDYEYYPEYLHYFQNVDELNIYENRFICMVIDLIDEELRKMSEFYSLLILSLDDKNILSGEEDYVNEAFKKINILEKRLKKIKSTYFYRFISKTNTKILHVVPSNILLKDRLYNYCFKFYKKMVGYTNKELLYIDFASYYFVILLKILKKNEFKLSRSTSKEVVFLKNKLHFAEPIIFSNSQFKIELKMLDRKYIDIKVINKDLNEIVSNNLLLVEPKLTLNVNVDDINSLSSTVYSSIEYITPWNRGYIDEDKNKSIRQNTMDEFSLMEQCLFDKMKVVKGSKDIYSKFCPLCRSKGLEENEDTNIYTCSSCSSSYIIYEKDEEEYLWFINYRREK